MSKVLNVYRPYAALDSIHFFELGAIVGFCMWHCHRGITSIVNFFKHFVAEQRKDITAASASMSMGKEMSQKLKEHKCLLVQIRPETSKTLWKKVNEVSPCPFDESEPSTPQTTSSISTKVSTMTRSVIGKQVDKKHMKTHGVTKKGQGDASKESTTKMAFHRDETGRTNNTNKRVAKQQLHKPVVNEKGHVTEPNIRSTTMKGETKPLDKRLVNATDPPEINKGYQGEVKEGNGGTSGIVLANSVMLVMTMYFIS